MGAKLVAECQPVGGKYCYYTTDQINSTCVVTHAFLFLLEGERDG